jgi:hypothetical protein
LFRRNESATPPVRYYLYISDAKLDMLFEQIDARTKRRISAQLNIDLQLASLTLSGAQLPPSTRASKLVIVERYLESSGSIGSVEAPQEVYFRGAQTMRWCWVGDREEGVWFEGYVPDARQCVGLGGSRHHVIGEAPADRTRSYTGRPAIMDALKRQGFLDLPELRRAILVDDFPELGRTVDLYWDPVGDMQRYAVSREADLFRDQQSGRSPILSSLQYLEFLAIRIADTVVSMRGTDVHVIVGTPLYVALASSRDAR